MTVAMMMHAMAVIAGDVFVKLSAETGGDGTSWDKALNAVTFVDRFKYLESGTNVYLTEGECVIGNTLQANEKSIILKGGYPDNLSGTEKEYQGYHGKTVLKGNGELSQLLSVYGALEKKVVIENIDFTNACYIVEPAEDKNVVIGALVINNCRNITVRNCNFYDNVSNAWGGIAVRSSNSDAMFVECTFYNNSAISHGSAIRLYSSDAESGTTTFERCMFFDNKVTGYKSATTELKGNIGSVIYVSNSRQVNIINSVIYANKADSGGAIYIPGKNNTYENKLVIVGSTIAGNNHIQLQQAGGALNLMLANSIVCCPTDTENSSNSGLFWDGTNEPVFVSGGYNITGSAYSAKTPLAESVWQTTDVHGKENNFKSVFGTESITSETIKTPVAATQGMPLAELDALVEKWNLPSGVDLSVDISCRKRIGTHPGAYNSLTQQVEISDVEYATYYSNLGYIMPDGVKGAVVKTEGDGILLDYRFGAGDVVPAKTPLLLKGKEGNYELEMCEASDNTVANADNMLRGSVEDEITEGFEDRDNINVKFYRLSYDNNRNAGFFWGAADGGVFTNAAGKAYLVMYPAEGGASLARSFTFGGDATSVGGIITGDDNSVKSAWYMLHGIRIKGMPARGGIYIRDGRKVVVR